MTAAGTHEPLSTGGVTTLKTDYATALGMISTDYACLNRSRYRGWHEIGRLARSNADSHGGNAGDECPETDSSTDKALRVGD